MIDDVPGGGFPAVLAHDFFHQSESQSEVQRLIEFKNQLGQAEEGFKDQLFIFRRNSKDVVFALYRIVNHGYHGICPGHVYQDHNKCPWTREFKGVYQNLRKGLVKKFPVDVDVYVVEIGVIIVDYYIMLFDGAEVLLLADDGSREIVELAEGEFLKREVVLYYPVDV